MRTLWIIEECVDRKWRPAQPWPSDSALVAFGDETEAREELQLWEQQDSRVRLVKYIPEHV